MAIEITMPRLSDTMEQGTVVKWNVKEGDEVSAGDVLADIETDKATMELESFDDGTVASLSIGEGQTVKVGEVIMVLAEEGESGDSAAAGATASQQATSGASSASTATVAPPPVRPGPTDSATSRVFASPLARKLAAEAGLDLSGVSGTGPSGRITRKDVEAAAGGTVGAAPAAPAQPAAQVSSPAPEPSDSAATVEAAVRTASPMPQPVAIDTTGSPLEHKVVPMSNMRGTIARRLVESKTSIPHYQVTVEADVDALMALRKQLNDQLADQGVKLTVNDFLVRACALAMHQHHFVNARWNENNGQPSIEVLPDVNVGVAIALSEERGGGLVVATLRGADRMGLRQISSQTRQLAEKARTKGLTIEEMSDSTFTISNLGMFGVEHFTAIINPPNAAILAVGGAIEKPVVKNGQVTIGRRMSMTMSSDHRIIDGAMAAQYLAAVKSLLEKPAALLV